MKKYYSSKRKGLTRINNRRKRNKRTKRTKIKRTKRRTRKNNKKQTKLKGGMLASNPEKQDKTYFLLIPGSNNKWGKGRDIPREGQGPSYWQTIIQEKVETDLIHDFFPLLNTRLNDSEPLDPSDPPGPPAWLRGCETDGEGKVVGTLRVGHPPAAGGSQFAFCGLLWGFEHLPEDFPDRSISVISTSQGSALISHFLYYYPKYIKYIKNIVYYSPAWTTPISQNMIDNSGVTPCKHPECPQHIIEVLKTIPTLLVDTEHGYGNGIDYLNRDGWGQIIRKHIIGNGIHHNFIIPTTQHSGDASKMTQKQCKSLDGSKFCNCSKGLSDADVKFNQIKIDTIWKHIYDWCVNSNKDKDKVFWTDIDIMLSEMKTLSKDVLQVVEIAQVTHEMAEHTLALTEGDVYNAIEILLSGKEF